MLRCVDEEPAAGLLSRSKTLGDEVLECCEVDSLLKTDVLFAFFLMFAEPVMVIPKDPVAGPLLLRLRLLRDDAFACGDADILLRIECSLLAEAQPLMVIPLFPATGLSSFRFGTREEELLEGEDEDSLSRMEAFIECSLLEPRPLIVTSVDFVAELLS